jgi:hypothetical protein
MEDLQTALAQSFNEGMTALVATRARVLELERAVVAKDAQIEQLENPTEKEPADGSAL